MNGISNYWKFPEINDIIRRTIIKLNKNIKEIVEKSNWKEEKNRLMHLNKYKDLQKKLIKMLPKSKKGSTK